VVARIIATGFGAQLLATDNVRHVAESASAQAEDLVASTRATIVKYRRLFIFSLILSLPVFINAMILPRVGASKEWLMTRVSGDATRMGIILWVLVTPVQFGVGSIFFKSAYGSLRHGSANMSVLIFMGTMAAYTFSAIDVIRSLLRDNTMAAMAAPYLVAGADGVLAPTLNADGSVATVGQMMGDVHTDEQGEHFFETSSTLITLVLLGRYLEAVARGRTSQALTELMSLQASSALLVEVEVKGNDGDGACAGDGNDSKQNGANGTAVAKITGDGKKAPRYRVVSEREVAVDELVPGDVVKVIRGAKVPADGLIVQGAGDVNESMVTGESLPVHKVVGGTVIGSTVCEDGTLLVRVTSTGAESTLSQILRLMEETQSSKAPIQAVADRISGVFVPIVVLIAIVSFCVWLALVETDSVPAEWLTKNDEGNFLFALLFAIAVLVIACPCALGLATPTAVMVGTGVGARLGILIKGGLALETAHNVTAVVFDKTGTLTEGRPRVVAVEVVPDGLLSARELAFVAGSAELDSEHVLGEAIVRFAREGEAARPKGVELELALVQPTEFVAVSGRGLRCVVEYARAFAAAGQSDAPATTSVRGAPTRRSVLIGNAAWMRDNAVDVTAFATAAMATHQAQGCTALLLAVNGAVCAVLALADAPKAESAAVIARLRDMHMDVYLCSGDHARTCAAVATQLGLPAEFIKSECTPATKFDFVKELQADGRIVAMIGDGINDSPALAQANLGVAMGTGTDASMEAADFVLVKSDLRDIVVGLHLSATVFARIRLNFFWALGYNILGIPIATGVFYPFINVRLPPEVAALAMALSSVSVVTSSLLLKRYRPCKV
jgi:Cu+-exporting ATPase